MKNTIRLFTGGALNYSIRAFVQYSSIAIKTLHKFWVRFEDNFFCDENYLQ